MIGGTELCELTALAPADAARILVKCEYRNPTGSHKDRVFHFMIDELERRGTIFPGWTLVECSTGNGGAALAQVGLRRGYRIVIIMPRAPNPRIWIGRSRRTFARSSSTTHERYRGRTPGR